jgi:hypothetical protein
MKVIQPKFGRKYIDENIKPEMQKQIIGHRPISDQDYTDSIQVR